jgi:acetyltransferase/esterase
MRAFAQLAGLRFDDLEPGVTLPAPSARRIANLTAFLSNDAPNAHRYELSGPLPTCIVPAAGTSSGDSEIGRRCVALLAERMGVSLAMFLGGHNGFLTHPSAFAAHAARCSPQIHVTMRARG